MSGRPIQPASARCRGSAYVAVLGTTMLVTLLGVSGLLAARLERAAHRADTEAARASLLTQSAADLALLQTRQPGWRSGLASGEWSATFALAGGSLRYRFLDEDGDLADDEDDRVTIETEAWFGPADAMRTRRLLAVELDPSRQRAYAAPSVVASGDMDDLLDWYTSPAKDAKLQRADEAGNYYMRIRSRKRADDCGALQNLTGRLTTPGRYDVSLRAKGNSNASDTLRLVVRLTTTGGTQHVQTVTATIGKSSWTDVAGELDLAWAGGLQNATLEIVIQSDQEFHLDDVALRPRDNRPAPIVPGSWRRIVRDN